MVERVEKIDLVGSVPTVPNECSFEAPSVDLVAADDSTNCLLLQRDSKPPFWRPETLQNRTAEIVPVPLYCLCAFEPMCAVV